MSDWALYLILGGWLLGAACTFLFMLTLGWVTGAEGGDHEHLLDPWGVAAVVALWAPFLLFAHVLAAAAFVRLLWHGRGLPCPYMTWPGIAPVLWPWLWSKIES